MREDIVWAVDYETHYTKDYSLKILPTRTYVYHDDFHAYLVAVSNSAGFAWVGAPSEFDWSLLEGQVVLHHNAQFDALVTQRLVEDGVIPATKFSAVHDTADLARFIQHPPALKDFARKIWGLTDIEAAGKKAREKMAQASDADLMHDPEILEYATNDAKLTVRLWQEFSDKWPDEERALSRLNREACFRGVAVDVAYVEQCCERLAQRLFDAERSIPWDWEDKKTPLARTKIIQHCESTIEHERPLSDIEARFYLNKVDGGEPALARLWKREGFRHLVDPFSRFEIFVSPTTNKLCARFFMWYPTSFAIGDEDCEIWEQRYAEPYPWVRAIRDWRRVNMLYQKVKHLRDNTFDGIYYPQIKYFGSRTGRFSGDGKFNMQNLPREEMFCEDGKPGTGCDLRRCFIARPHHKLAMIDYAQIEARALVASVGDEALVSQLRSGMSIYEAHARATMNWTGGKLKDENPELYRLAKARVLGLGYGCGRVKFVIVAKLLAGLDLTVEEARVIVDDFRARNPGIVSLWAKLDQKVRFFGAAQADECSLPLHSGRSLHYWSPRFRETKTQRGEQLMAMFSKNDPSSYRKAYGGLLTENCIQGLCRDILRDGWISLDKAGFKVLWTIHDEYVVELPEEQDVAEAEAVLLKLPEWAKFIPVEVESTVGQHYTK